MPQNHPMQQPPRPKPSPKAQRAPQKQRAREEDERLDESIDESFPASDPPAHRVSHLAPDEEAKDDDEDARDTQPDARHHSRAFYAEARRHAARSDDAHAFVSDVNERQRPLDDDLAETLGEDFLSSATSGEEVSPEVFDEPVSEELGGPFITVPGEREFAAGTDASNPPGAEKAAFPTANAGPARSR